MRDVQSRVNNAPFNFFCFSLQGANFVSADALRGFQRRLCFYSGHEPPPFITPDDDVTCIPLTRSNVYQVRNLP